MTDSERRLLDIDVSNLVVTEDGVEQTIDTFQEAVSPVSIILALDTSGSMKKWVDTAKAAAASFVNALRPQDALGVVMFADRSELVVDLGTGRDKAHAAIAGYTRRWWHRALRRAWRFARAAEEGRKGGGSSSSSPMGATRTIREPARAASGISSRLLDAAESVGAVIFGIGMGQRVDRPVLTTLATSSGGDAYFPDDVAQLEAEYRRIVENLRRRWIISYTSTNSLRDGAWRPVTIRTKGGKAVVHSRGGYFAPEK